MVVLIKEKLKAAGDCQKSYASNRHKPQEFDVRDQVLLKVSSWKDVVYFGKKEMLGPRDVGPFEIIKGIKEIKVDKTLHFVEESVKIIDREVKENQEKDKIGSKPDKNGKCGKARKSQKQLQLKEEEKPKKTKKEWPKTHARIKSY
nr:hypothetical protein [Tanacetum cinerariifolium]